MLFKLFTVDSFTKTPFSGNPAAVCPLEQDIPDDLKQKIATEMNIAETAFITRFRETDDFQSATRFGLRWFTPTNEVPLCGHATLASAAVLFNCLNNQNSKLEFETLSGTLRATKDASSRIVLDMPRYDPEPLGADEVKVAELVKVTIGGLPTEEVQFSPGMGMLVIRLQDSCSRTEFETFQPIFNKMIAADGTGQVRGVIATRRSEDKSYDFLSRYFGPWDGNPEDPTTGSSHAVLAPYWSKILDKKAMSARQCSRRGGDLLVKLTPDGRVEVAGHAVVVLKAQLQL